MTRGSFPDRARVDARDKVRGATLFAADVAIDGMLFAMTVPASIARGSVTALDLDAARAVAGVVRILTPPDFAGVIATPYLSGGGAAPGHQPMLDDQVVHRGQPIALVVAETLEAAVEAASLVRASYLIDSFAPTMESLVADREPAESGIDIGHADSLVEGSEVRTATEYHHPAQHHNPIELISTTAVWRDGELTVYEGTQNSGGLKFGIAGALGLDPERVHVRSPYVGGAFGQKNMLQHQTVLVARAAMLLGRPVKLVMPRGQLFHTASFRPASVHRIRLGADRSGHLTAAVYEAEQQNSRIDGFPSDYGSIAPRVYGFSDYRSSERSIRIDTQPVGFMRAPQEHPASFAFESAIDEMSYRLDADPVEFRLANDAAFDPVTGKPFTSRYLAECLREGAARFGWERRIRTPGSMRAPDGTQLGWGVASGCYKTVTAPAIARLRIEADGGTMLAVSGHEMGQGIRTAIEAALLSELDIDARGIEIRVGDPDAAPQHLTAGSWGTASALPVVRQACLSLSEQLSGLERLAGRTPGGISGGTMHERLARVGRSLLEVEVSGVAPGQPPVVLDRLKRGQPAALGPEYPDFVSFSFIAHFVEVRVEPTTRRVRVPRVVSIVDCGRVISPRTAASQLRGGVVWGIGAALREQSEVDPRFGFVLNSDLADYLVPVNADIGEIEVGFIDEPDPMINSLGLKSVGEVSMVGVAAAVANAVYHATGRRIRRLPIRIEDLL